MSGTSPTSRTGGRDPSRRALSPVPADLADQFPEPGADLARHDRLSVLGDPDQLQVDLEGGVRAAPVVLHGGASYTTGAALQTR